MVYKLGMIIKSFRIKNYKGIVDTTIKLDGGKQAVYALVGLNESGKTTILEALNSFRPDTDGIHGVAQKQLINPTKESLVPKSQKANFNDSIEITAEIQLEDAEVESILKEIEDGNGFKVERESFPKKFNVIRYFGFKDSKHTRTWTLSPSFRPKIKKKGTRKYKEVKSPDNHCEIIIERIRQEFPRIVYFPTFLFDFPNKILLSEPENEVLDANEKVINDYFKEMFSEALVAIDPNATLQTHVVDRVLNTKKDSPFDAFFRFWFGSDEKEQVDSTISKLAEEITKEVFGKWEKVLGSKIGQKQLVIEITPETDDTGQRLVYLSLFIKDGTSKYKVSERSLGFRWFFSFLLFTKYFKGNKNGESIFLFDEPAANLHSMAQNKLLDSFEDIAGDKNTIIYTTHSHYLINPHWLENTYIVTNGEPKDAEVVNVEYDDADADIKAEKYKSFVGSHSQRHHYFQPILDKLQIQPLPIEARQGGVITEGKSDYYILNWYKKFHAKDLDINFLSVEGAGNASALISLNLGLANDFAVLLDSDKAGGEAKRKYLDKLPVKKSQIVQIGDIWPDKKQIEDVISDGLKKQIETNFGSPDKNTKDLILMAFAQELCGGGGIEADKETLGNLKKLTDELTQRLSPALS